MFRTQYHLWQYSDKSRGFDDVKTEPNLCLTPREIVSRYTHDQIVELNDQIRAKSDALEAALSDFEDVQFKDITDLQNAQSLVTDMLTALQGRISADRLKRQQDVAQQLSSSGSEPLMPDGASNQNVPDNS